MPDQATTPNWHRRALQDEVELRWLATRLFAILTAICAIAALVCSLWSPLSNLIAVFLVLDAAFLSVTGYAGFTYWFLEQRLQSADGHQHTEVTA